MVLVHVVPDVRPNFLYVQLDPPLQLGYAALHQKRIFQLLRKVNVPGDDFHVADTLKRFRNTVLHESLHCSVKVLEELDAVHRTGIHVLLKINVVVTDFELP